MKHANVIFLTLGVFLSAAALAQPAASFAPVETISDGGSASREDALRASGLDKYVSDKNDRTLANANLNVEKIKNSVGSKFGGSWIEYDAQNNARHFVGVKGQIDASQKASIALEGDSTQIVNVKYSYAELQELQKKILGEFLKLSKGNESLVFSVAIDEPKNKLIIRGRKDNLTTIQIHLRTMGVDLDAVYLEPQDGPVTFMGTLYGGTKIGSSLTSVSPMYLCTAGFNVIIDDIYPGAITAAHCYVQNTSQKYVFFNIGNSPTNSAKGQLIGEYFANGWIDNMDAVIFGNTDFVHTLPPQITTPGYGLATVKPVTTPITNSTVCTTGGSSGWRCGIQKSTSSAQYINGKLFNFAEASFCGGPGDSGGPVVSNQFNALGIYVGVIGNVPGGTCGPIFGQPPNSVFQPLGPYLARYNNVKIYSN
jgi:streptogrisin C